MSIQELLSNPLFWVGLFALAYTGLSSLLYNALKGLGPVASIFSKQRLLAIGLVGAVVTFGIAGGFSGSLDRTVKSGVPAGFQITDLQVTTAFTSDAGPAQVENANQDDLIDWRAYDANVTETAGSEEWYTGVITVTRSGELDPYSCPVSTIMPASYADEAGDDGRRYNIVEKTTTGFWEVYLNDGAAATINSQKQQTMLSFSDGEGQTTLGIAMEIDEEGHDALNANSYKDVIINICGKPLTLRTHRMD